MEILNNDLNNHDKNTKTTTPIMIDTNYNDNNHKNENNHHHQNSDINTSNSNSNNYKSFKNQHVINDDTNTTTTHHIKSHNSIINNDDEPEIVMSFRTGNIIFSSHILLDFCIPFIDISYAYE
jgi:hypothetical protein